MYLKLYYHSRVKAEFLQRYNLAMDEWEAASDDKKLEQKLVEPTAVGIRNKVGKEIWGLEISKVREEVMAAAKEKHKNEMAEWKEAQKPPETPQEFHQ